MKQDQRGLKGLKDPEKNTDPRNVAMRDSQMSFLKTPKVRGVSLKKKEKRTLSGEDAFEELTLKPVERHGKRNVYCSYYSLCLDHAIQKGWQYWDCDACPKKDVRKPLEGAGDAPTQDFEYHGLGHMRTEEF